MIPLKQFLRIHGESKSDGQRLGQRFVNMYIKKPWPELFYEQNEHAAKWMIEQWLIDHQYTSELPQELAKS